MTIGNKSIIKYNKYSPYDVCIYLSLPPKSFLFYSIATHVLWERIPLNLLPCNQNFLAKLSSVKTTEYVQFLFIHEDWKFIQYWKVVLTQGCKFGLIVNLARNTTDAATKEGKNLRQL